MLHFHCFAYFSPDTRASSPIMCLIQFYHFKTTPVKPSLIPAASDISSSYKDQQHCIWKCCDASSMSENAIGTVACHSQDPHCRGQVASSLLPRCRVGGSECFCVCGFSKSAQLGRGRTRKTIRAFNIKPYVNSIITILLLNFKIIPLWSYPALFFK